MFKMNWSQQKQYDKKTLIQVNYIFLEVLI